MNISREVPLYRRPGREIRRPSGRPRRLAAPWLAPLEARALLSGDPVAPLIYSAMFPSPLPMPGPPFNEEGVEPPVGSVMPVAAGFAHPTGFAMDGLGDLFIADSGTDQVFETLGSGLTYLVAGSGHAGFGGDGGPAASAILDGPTGLAVDDQGDLFIADSGNNRIREVTSDGNITTIAGTGVAGFVGDGGPASLASLNQPTGLAVDSRGDLFLADSDNNRVREIAGGRIGTVAGNGFSGFGGDGGAATRASLDRPTGLAIDGQGDLYIADTANNRVREVLSTGVMITVAGNGQAGSGGNDEQSNVAQLDHPTGVVIDGDGDLFIADTGDGAIRAVNPQGIVSVVGTIGGPTSGDEGQGFLGQSPSSGMDLSLIAGDGFGNVFASDTLGQAVQVASDPDDSLIGPPKADLTESDDGVGLTSQLLPLARTSLELAATLVIVSIEGGEAVAESAVLPNQPAPSGRSGSVLRIDLTSEESETGDPYAPTVPSPLLEYLLGLNVSFAEGPRIITAPLNVGGATTWPAPDRQVDPTPGPEPDGPEVPRVPAEPTPATPAPEGAPDPSPADGTAARFSIRSNDRDPDRDRRDTLIGGEPDSLAPVARPAPRRLEVVIPAVRGAADARLGALFLAPAFWTSKPVRSGIVPAGARRRTPGGRHRVPEE